MRSEEEGISTYLMTLRKRGNTEICKDEVLYLTLENSLWKRLWNCGNTDYGNI
jgi:hypothetical protein